MLQFGDIAHKEYMIIMTSVMDTLVIKAVILVYLRHKILCRFPLVRFPCVIRDGFAWWSLPLDFSSAVFVVVCLFFRYL